MTILGPPINRRQDAFGHTYDPVNLGVDFIGPCTAPDGKDSAVSGGQAHGHDLVGGQLPAQGLPGSVNALVKKRRAQYRLISDRPAHTKRCATAPWVSS